MQVLPDYLETHRDRIQNFSLYFDKFSVWESEQNKPPKSKISEQILEAPRILRHAESVLNACHDRQRLLLRTIHRQGGFYLELRSKLVSPFVSGLGGCHPTDTGFVLDRNTGLPYIPASGIKGVLRLAHALNLAEHEPDKVRDNDGEREIPDDEVSMRKYFGDTDTKRKDAVRGQLVFLDAFPASVPTMRRDIMNPHFGGYYKGEHGPIETENPIPVPFMTVAEGVEFVFRIFALPLAEGAKVPREFGGDDRTAVIAMFARACTELGFGAKTAIGYGRFDTPQDVTASLLAEWKKLDDEKDARQNPWKQEIPRIQAAANWGDFKQQVLENPNLVQYQELRDVAEVVAAKAGELRRQWRGDDREERDRFIAEWLKPSGISWPPPGDAAAPQDHSARAAAELERLKSITKWADYMAAPAAFELLGKSGIKLMKEKLKQWGCHDKNASDEKKAELNRFNEFLGSRQSG